MAETSKDGVWVDTKSGEVVNGPQPEEAIQLVAPGGEITADVQKRIDAEHAADSDDASDDEAEADDDADAKKAVPAKRAASKR